MPRETNITIRRGSAQTWETVNPVLNSGELGFDTTNNLVKIGNQVDTWSDLPALSKASPLEVSATYLDNKLVIQTPIISFLSIADTNICTVPNGYMLFIDTMEIITTNIVGAGDPPIVRFGNTENYSAYYEPNMTTSNGIGKRHVIQSPQDAAYAGTTVTFGIQTASTASTHNGIAVITGYVIKAESGAPLYAIPSPKKTKVIGW
jgi:hypothetical protein